MAAPKNITLDLDGNSHIGGARLRPDPWQSSPLTITGTLTVSLMAAVTSVVAEIFDSAGDLVADVTGVASGGTYTFDWTTEDMALDMDEKESRVFTLQITGRNVAGDDLQPLGKWKLNFQRNQFSGSSAPVLSPFYPLRVHSITPNDDGTYQVRFGSKTGKLIITDVEDA